MAVKHFSWAFKDLSKFNVDIEDESATSFIQEHLKNLTVLEDEEKHNTWNFIINSESFTLVVTFGKTQP